MAAAGFVDVVAEDRTDDLRDSMIEERQRLVDEVAGFLTDFTREEYDGLLDRWDKKIEWCRHGDLRWIVLHARRAKG